MASIDSQPAPPPESDPECIGGRYLVRGVLGRGGMAVVHHVTDTALGRDVALKLLAPQEEKRRHETMVLFEREFHTLAQLSHPRVIEVYDYRLEGDAAYYTMELLDGRDLRERSPLPWREACSLLHDVCSSLALLHSRRLIHRDVSPRNIRCTRDGLAKLIDFGALLPMSTGGRIVGTPPFVAPEVVHRLATDARTDLFSLGATLYYALTGRTPYSARDFPGLTAAWRVKPHLPSSFAPDVPPALDDLVMSLLSLEPALRPRAAFEVMQRLAALAGIERVEPSSVSQAYLSTPVMVGRAAALATLRAQIACALDRRGNGVLITGRAGVGRSRMLNACMLEAKTMGATVLHASASVDGRSGSGVVQALAEQLRDAFPDAVALAEQGSSDELRALCHAITPQHVVVIAVDDVHRIDAASAALLAALAHELDRRKLFLALTVEHNAQATAPAALALLAEQCARLELQPLSEEQTLELLKSVFGDVPNVALASARIHQVARGNPRECMDLAQHLVDKRSIVYAGGVWALPISLTAAELPSNAEQVFWDRVAALPPLARWLAQTQALASHATFTRDEYCMLAAGSDPQRVDEAITELVAQQVLVSDGCVYALAHSNRIAAFGAQLAPAELAQRHRALSVLYDRGAEFALAAIHHLASAGEHERALDRLQQLLASVDDIGGLIALPQIGREHLQPMLEGALAAAQRLGRRAREVHELRRWLTALSIISDDAVYWSAAPAWLAQLERDSGLRAWRELADVGDPGERLRRALERTQQEQATAPEAERVYRIDEAIKWLVNYVAISIAVAARTQDARLIVSLAPLLEPFAPLSPLVEAMWQNAICTYEANCSAQQDRARLRATDLYTRLAKYSETELRYVGVIRNALAYCVGAIEANLGLQSAMRWAQVLDQDPLQQVNAMHIRKIMRLQLGDPEGAERYRKQAEVLAVQASMRQMFTTTATIELAAYATAHDLTGVKQVIDVIEPLAARHSGWVPFRHLAEGHFQRLRGNLEAGLAAYERCLALASPDPEQTWRSISTWPRAIASALEVLTELGRLDEARSRGEQALALGRARGVNAGLHEVSRALAVAEAKLGEYARATERLAGVIAEQIELGVSGLNLGASYAARTRIAIWAGDTAAVEEYGQLTAREYRHGRGSPLGALYERLMGEARRAGVIVLPQLSEFESTMMPTTRDSFRPSLAAHVAAALGEAETAAERARRALRVLCEARGSNAGHLYLFREDGLVLAASEPDAQRSDGLLEFVHGYVAQALEPEQATMIVTEASSEAARRAPGWTDSDGVVHQPLLLGCIVSGIESFVGIAVLRAGGRHDRHIRVSETATAVAAHLLATGDARAVPVQGPTAEQDTLRGRG